MGADLEMVEEEKSGKTDREPPLRVSCSTWALPGHTCHDAQEGGPGCTQAWCPGCGMRGEGHEVRDTPDTGVPLVSRLLFPRALPSPAPMALSERQPICHLPLVHFSLRIWDKERGC